MARINISIPSVFIFVVLGFLGTTRMGFAGGHSVDANALTAQAAVDAFLRTHAGNAFEDAVLGDFRIIDLDQDGRTDLVATIDSSGRGFFNHLLVLHDNGEQLTVQEVDVWNMKSLEGSVQDIDGDGRPELLLRKNLTPYVGARPMATWTAAFRFDGKELVDQSGHFTQFYESVLSRLDHDIAVSSTEYSEDIYRKDVLNIERDKILRLLGRPLDAGLPSALRWAHSEDTVHRIFALAILSEIDSSEAASALKALSGDLDPEVSTRARIAAKVQGDVP